MQDIEVYNGSKEAQISILRKLETGWKVVTMMSFDGHLFVIYEKV